jgi:hypothetical protein
MVQHRRHKAASLRDRGTVVTVSLARRFDCPTLPPSFQLRIVKLPQVGIDGIFGKRVEQGLGSGEKGCSSSHYILSHSATLSSRFVKSGVESAETAVQLSMGCRVRSSSW